MTSIAAVRAGALDLAVGNLFGSNGFNMAIYFALDLASPEGSVFSALAPVQVVTGLCGVALTSLGLAAIVYRAERRFAMLEPDAAIIVLAYLCGLVLFGVYGVPGERRRPGGGSRSDARRQPSASSIALVRPRVIRIISRRGTSCSP